MNDNIEVVDSKVLFEELVKSATNISQLFGASCRALGFDLGKPDIIGGKWSKQEAEILKTRLEEMGFRQQWDSDLFDYRYKRFTGHGIEIEVKYEPELVDTLKDKIEELERLSGKKIILEDISTLKDEVEEA